MARKNQKGNPFMALGLEKADEKKMKEILKERDISGKQLLRSLVRKYIKDYEAKPKDNNG